jgi:hypothetical protein
MKIKSGENILLFNRYDAKDYGLRRLKVCGHQRIKSTVLNPVKDSSYNRLFLPNHTSSCRFITRQLKYCLHLIVQEEALNLGYSAKMFGSHSQLKFML